MNLEIANRLLALRREHGYSQEELAYKLGVSRQAVSKWERAESSPDTDNLLALARLYGVSLDALLLHTPAGRRPRPRRSRRRPRRTRTRRFLPPPGLGTPRRRRSRRPGSGRGPSGRRGCCGCSPWR
ncbi:MAG: helix-turn-helix transcriptional regulator [Flavonifractor plautii]